MYARFKDNLRAADSAEMGLLSSKNHSVKHLLCVIDVFTKYAWIKSLKDKEAKTFLNGFIEIVNKSNRKPNQLWIDQEREFFNNIIQKRSDHNDILMYSTHNEGKSVVAKKFIIKNKVYRTNDG